MGTWCTKGVKEDFARTHQRNHINDLAKSERKLRVKVKRLRDDIKDLQHRNDWLWEERTKALAKLGATPEEASDPDEYLPNWIPPNAELLKQADAAKPEGE
ncbi:MAG: hypothetical protein V3V96_10615 [Acidiferrobacterales bacterium]